MSATALVLAASAARRQNAAMMNVAILHRSDRSLHSLKCSDKNRVQIYDRSQEVSEKVIASISSRLAGI